MTKDEVEQQLLELRDQREQNTERLRQIRNEMDRLVIEADKLGLSKAGISRSAGLTRQTVYGILLRRERA